MMLLSWFYTLRSYISTYGRSIRSRWLYSLVWVLAAAAIIWFYGDQLSLGGWRPLEPRQHRLIAIGLIFLAWLVYLIVSFVRGRRADKALIGAVTAPDPQRAAAEDVAEVRSRLRQALKLLRKSLGRRDYLYQLPWYVLIGPPGAGKTTALCNSGLKFPLARELGSAPIEGVAGTRHCDWWFTDEAILIDTAGRYTLQDSDAIVDKAGWSGFLRLLKRHRRRQPLNGALVMLGLDELMEASPTTRLQQARIIRNRLRELDETFGLRVPSYLILTKADRLAGFDAFFDHLEASAREQVWGVTLPPPQEEIEGQDLADRIARSFDRLVERLNGLVLERLQQENDRERRTRILAFPSQVALIAEPLHEMIGEIAASSRFDPPPRIRGLYLASAQQEGARTDLVARGANAHFGLDFPTSTPSEENGAKSFFLARLFNDVIFGEANLVSIDQRRHPWRSRLRRFSLAVAVIAAASLCAFWIFAFLGQERLLAGAETKLAAYDSLAKDVPSRAVADGDFVKTAELLDQIRDPAMSLETQRKPYFGVFDQSDKVGSGDHDLYNRALDLFLAPRILVRQQQEIHAGRGPDLADRARVYLMITGKAPIDPGFVKTFMRADFEKLLPGDEHSATRRSLDSHVAAMLAKPILPIATDEAFLGELHTKLKISDISEKWAASGRSFCESVASSYPLDTKATADISIEDFGKLFGPKGVFDSFFRDNLQGLVDTSASPWRWRDELARSSEGNASLIPFEQAAAIEAAFFRDNPAAPSFSFEVTPASLDGGTAAMLLASNGQEVSYTGGPARPTRLSWPNPGTSSEARVAVLPDGPGSALIENGPWALFRLVEAGNRQKLDPNGLRVGFALAGHRATFDLRIVGAFNPFAAIGLSDFRCPQKL